MGPGCNMGRLLNVLATNYLKEWVVLYCPPKTALFPDCWCPCKKHNTSPLLSLPPSCGIIFLLLSVKADTLFIFKSRPKTFLFCASHNHEYCIKNPTPVKTFFILLVSHVQSQSQSQKSKSNVVVLSRSGLQTAHVVPWGSALAYQYAACVASVAS